MSIGPSGRIVIEVEPELKQALHDALRRNGSNLKEWFIEQAEQFLAGDQEQLEFPSIDPLTDTKEGTG